MWARGNTEQVADEGPHPSLMLWLRFRKYGVMPVGGGLLDQDPDLLDDFDLIEAVVAKAAKHGK